MIHAKARKIDAKNPEEAASGYKNYDSSTFLAMKKSIKVIKVSNFFIFDANFNQYLIRFKNFQS